MGGGGAMATEDVYDALSKRYLVCRTAFNLSCAQAQAASAEIQAARCRVRDCVADVGVRHASVLPALDALHGALSLPGADSADEAARVAADIEFLRGADGADSATNTWLAAALYVCLYLAPNDAAAARSMLPQIAMLSGSSTAELFWDLPARRWLVREPGGPEILATPVLPPDKRCACAGCPERGAKLCAACKRVRYCSKKCQLAAWPGHKAVCKLHRRE